MIQYVSARRHNTLFSDVRICRICEAVCGVMLREKK